MLAEFEQFVVKFEQFVVKFEQFVVKFEQFFVEFEQFTVEFERSGFQDPKAVATDKEPATPSMRALLLASAMSSK